MASQKKGKTYPNRQPLFESIRNSDSIGKLNIDELIYAHGKPDRIGENYFYSLISRNKVGSLILNQKTGSLNDPTETRSIE